MGAGGPDDDGLVGDPGRRDSRSSVEWTATIGMPSSRQVRATRSAISPRFAMSTLREHFAPSLAQPSVAVTGSWPLATMRTGVAVLDRLVVGDVDVDHAAGTSELDRDHQLHRLDDANLLPASTTSPIETNGVAPGCAAR